MRQSSTAVGIRVPTRATKISSRDGIRFSSTCAPQFAAAACTSPGLAVVYRGPFVPHPFPAQHAGKLGRPGLGFRKAQCQTAMGRLDVVERGAEDDPPLVDHGHMIGHAFHFVQQMGREQDGSPLVGNGADDRLEDVAADNRIEARGRLIQHQQLRAVSQGDQQVRARRCPLERCLTLAFGSNSKRPRRSSAYAGSHFGKNAWV